MPRKWRQSDFDDDGYDDYDEEDYYEEEEYLEDKEPTSTSSVVPGKIFEFLHHFFMTWENRLVQFFSCRVWNS